MSQHQNNIHLINETQSMGSVSAPQNIQTQPTLENAGEVTINKEVTPHKESIITTHHDHFDNDKISGSFSTSVDPAYSSGLNLGLDPSIEIENESESENDEELLDQQEAARAAAEREADLAQLEKLAASGILEELDEDFNFDDVENLLELTEAQFPRFTLAKNKARFLRMVGWYRQKEEWVEVAPMSGVTRLFKQQTKELEGIRSAKLDYEMELETGTLTPSQRSYRKDELKMCRVQEKMAVHLIGKLQLKIRSGRR